jgi:hypothetical protein
VQGDRSLGAARRAGGDGADDQDAPKTLDIY